MLVTTSMETRSNHVFRVFVSPTFSNLVELARLATPGSLNSEN